MECHFRIWGGQGDVNAEFLRFETELENRLQTDGT